MAATKHPDDGRALRDRLFGEAFDEAFANHASAAIAPDLNAMSDEILFGRVWTRPGLALPLRSLVTIAALTALGKEAPLRLHIRGGLRDRMAHHPMARTRARLAHSASIARSKTPRRRPMHRTVGASRCAVWPSTTDRIAVRRYPACSAIHSS